MFSNHCKHSHILIADDAANEFDQEHLGPGEGGEMYRLSDGEIQDADAYSEISSDENFPDSQEIDLEQMEVPAPLLYAVMPFSPYNLEVTKPQVSHLAFLPLTSFTV
jgi:hypothetical protein